MWYTALCCIAGILFFGLLIYLHYKYAPKNKTFEFKGITENVKRAPPLKVKKRKPKKTFKKNTPQISKVSSFKKSTSKNEEVCRQILEKIFKKKFTSVRPHFLKNPVTNKNLELDCYNDELKLALEYDGAQHAKYVPKFHGDNKWNFIYQVRKDGFKTKLCKQHGIRLIRVPHQIPTHKLEKYITDRIKEMKIK